jgi:hypothetical protein
MVRRSWLLHSTRSEWNDLPMASLEVERVLVGMVGQKSRLDISGCSQGMKRGSSRHEGLYGLSHYHLDRSFVQLNIVLYYILVPYKL